MPNRTPILRRCQENCIQIVYNLRKTTVPMWENLWPQFAQVFRKLWIAAQPIKTFPTSPYISTQIPPAHPHNFPQHIFQQKSLLST